MNDQNRFDTEVMDELKWHEHNHRILAEFGKVTEGIVAEGNRHRDRMAQMGIADGFNMIFKGDRNG